MNDTEIGRYTGHATLTMVRRYDKSKEGTKVKEMFERTKREHPELILKMVSEYDNSASNNTSLYGGAEIIEIVRDNDRKNVVIENLNQKVKEAEKQNADIKKSAEEQAKQLKHYGVIEKEFEEKMRKSETDRADLLTMLMKLGYSYDEYIDIVNSQSSFDDEILKADLGHDTLLDD